MGNIKALNVSELINEYNEDFINSISLHDISSSQGLKELLNKLKKANYVVTEYYEMVYNDYILMINSDSQLAASNLNIDTVRKYKSLASRIQKAYNYVLYISTFENPFKRVIKQ